MRRARGSSSTCSSQGVSSYGWSSRCECPSMRPGSSVVPGRSTTTASAGTPTPAAGPTATIRSPRTATAQPSCGRSPVPSNTRAGRSKVTRVVSPELCAQTATGVRPAATSTAERRARDASIERMGLGAAGARWVRRGRANLARAVPPCHSPGPTRWARRQASAAGEEMTLSVVQTGRVVGRFVDANGVRLHCVEAGDGPLVLLLHGFPQFWYAWRHQIPALVGAGFRVVAPDLRGYNLSAKPPGVESYALDVLAADVADLVGRLGERSATLIGHDWGAAIAWRVASVHAAAVARVVAINGPHPRAFARELRTLDQL